MIPQIALHADQVTISATSSTPSAAQTARFEAHLDNGAAIYVAPSMTSTLTGAPNPLLQQASKLSEGFRAGLSKPLDIPENATMEQQFDAFSKQELASQCLIFQLDCASKTVDLGTKNVQTLYQMQG